MDTISRGSWSRASGELCKAATHAALHAHYHDDPDEHDDTDDHHRRRGGEATPLFIDQRKTLSTIESYVGADEENAEGMENGKKSYQSGSPPLPSISKPEAVGRSRSISQMVTDEARSMVNLAVPVIGTYLLEMLPGIVSIVLVGHVRSPHTKEYIDACALAVMFINLTGLSVGFGLASAMDTLCSQAYGAGELHRMGLYLQTGIIVLAVAFVCVFFLNYYAGQILILLGQPVEVSELAGMFALWLIPGIPFLYMYELLRKILQAQNIALPMLYVAIAANVVNAGLGYYLVYFTGVGWLGAAISRTASNVSFLLFMFPYLYASGSWKSFWGDGWDIRAAWRGISQFVKLGIPGALQLCFEWWAFEVLALVSGLLPDAVLAIGTNAVLLNIASMVYMLYLGVSIAGNVRIGNALGAGAPKRASLASTLAIGFGVLCSLLCAIVLIAFRMSLPAIFTHDPEIGAYCSRLLYIAAAFQLPDAINGAVQGIFRGSGRQSLGAWLNFVAYYVLGIPLGVLLAFHFNFGLGGLWVGMTAGLMFVSVVGTYIISRSDWSALADEAMERLD